MMTINTENQTGRNQPCLILVCVWFVCGLCVVCVWLVSPNLQNLGTGGA